MGEKIGFIGLGHMGALMAEAILKTGFPITIWNRTKSKTEELARKGAKVADSPKEVASQSDVVITMVSDGTALKAVCLGVNGALAGAKSGDVLIDMSTVDPESSSEVAQVAGGKGVRMLRAPVSGSTVLASQGKLTIFASGDKQAYERCQPIFSTMGQKIFYVGSADEARYIKLVLNTMVGITSQMLAEAITFGEKAGVDWNTMLEVIGNSVLASPLVAYKLPPLSKRDFKAVFTASMMAKDFDLALATGDKIGAPMPTVSLVRQFLGALKASNRGELDFSALLLVMEELSGIKAKETK